MCCFSAVEFSTEWYANMLSWVYDLLKIPPPSHSDLFVSLTGGLRTEVAGAYHAGFGWYLVVDDVSAKKLQVPESAHARLEGSFRALIESNGGGKLFTFPVVKKKARLVQLLAEAAAEAAAAAERERLQAEEERAAAAAAADSGLVGGRQDVASLRQLSRGAEQPRNMYEDDDGRDMDNPDGGQIGEGGANQAGSRRRGGRGGGPPPGVRGPPGGQGGNAIKSGLAAG